MIYKKHILEDHRLLRKFCAAMDHHYGCKQAFGTSKDSYGQCLACPLACAEQSEYLINLKNLPLGEAVKATLRGPVSAEEAHEILQAYARLPRPYPDTDLKPNEAAAHIARQRQDRPGTEDDE